MVIAISIFVFGVWDFRQTDSRVMHRALSIANLNDFSWRNRVAAWEGDLQMMVDRPWLGLGWGQAEPFYDRYYSPNRIDEAAAIRSSDYLLLGATLGLPALICFCLYLRRSFGSEPARREARPAGVSDVRQLDWLKATCRAAAVVLAVGFWFDGGLFQLPTAATFWIFLELGRVDRKASAVAESAMAD
jgi:putative inorganic carbon (HCO3(-)) transporter